jgi:hypothetical protein
MSTPSSLLTQIDLRTLAWFRFADEGANYTKGPVVTKQSNRVCVFARMQANISSDCICTGGASDATSDYPLPATGRRWRAAVAAAAIAVAAAEPAGPPLCNGSREGRHRAHACAGAWHVKGCQREVQAHEASRAGRGDRAMRGRPARGEAQSNGCAERRWESADGERREHVKLAVRRGPVAADQPCARARISWRRRGDDGRDDGVRPKLGQRVAEQQRVEGQHGRW